MPEPLKKKPAITNKEKEAEISQRLIDKENKEGY